MGRVVALEDLREEVARGRTKGETFAFANGHFDLLHVGHLRYLSSAAREASRLIVAVNGDTSIRRLKGPERPIVPATERAELLAGLAAVDFVVVFDDDSPERLLADLQPEVHCKGTDYGTPQKVPEYDVVQAYGGQTRLVGDPKDHATSDLISKIKELGRTGAGSS